MHKQTQAISALPEQNNEGMREILLKSFDHVINAAIPDHTLPNHLPSPPKGKTYVIGAGKAAARMAQTFEKHYKGSYEGFVITRYGHNVPTNQIQVIEAAHPVPDENGRKAAQKMLRFIQDAGPEDLVICLLSGGGSSLLTMPCENLDFEEIRNINKSLLGCGASIYEINTVRKHLNQTFGGRITKAASPAPIITLSISDVAWDDPSVIASGPTIGDPTTLEDTLNILNRYDIKVSDQITAHLKNPESETPKPEDAIFKNAEYQLIAAPQIALEKAASFLQAQGFTPHILSSNLEGDTNESALFHVNMLRQIYNYEQPFKRGCAIISGGETTVKLTGNGDGGPNTQFMLQSAIALNGLDSVYGLACDTDGIDGTMDNAGAIIDPNTLEKARKNKIDASKMLAENNSYRFFEALDDLIIPGPTYTNVNDYRIFIIRA